MKNRGKKLQKEKKRACKLWDNFKLSNTQVTEVPKGEMGKGGWKEEICKKIVAKKDSNLMKTPIRKKIIKVDRT